MISDVLFEAVERIDDYLRDLPEVYGRRSTAVICESESSNCAAKWPSCRES